MKPLFKLAVFVVRSPSVVDDFQSSTLFSNSICDSQTQHLGSLNARLSSPPAVMFDEIRVVASADESEGDVQK